MMEILHLLHSKIKAFLVTKLFFPLKRSINYFIITRKAVVLWVWKCFVSVVEQPFQPPSHSLQATAHLAQQTHCKHRRHLLLMRKRVLTLANLLFPQFKEKTNTLERSRNQLPALLGTAQETSTSFWEREQQKS